MSGFAERRAIFSFTVNEAVDRVLPLRFVVDASREVDAECRSDRNVGESVDPIPERKKAKSKKSWNLSLFTFFCCSSLRQLESRSGLVEVLSRLKPSEKRSVVERN